MTYFMKNSESLHFTTLKSALAALIKEPPDIFFISREGDKLYSKQALLALHSPLIAGMLDGVKDDCPGVSIDFSSATISTLLNLLSNGQAVTNNKNDLEKVNPVAATLGINMNNLVIETKSVTQSEDEYNLASNSSDEVGNTTARENKTKDPNKLDNIITTTQEDESKNYNIEKIEEVYVDSTFEPPPSVSVDDLSCGACFKLFKNKRGLKKHLTLSCKGKLFQCNKCGNQLYQCNKCGKGFDRKADLKRHSIRVYCDRSQELPHKCYHCDKTFVQIESLRLHAKSQHEIELEDVDKGTEIDYNESYGDETEVMDVEFHNTQSNEYDKIDIIKEEFQDHESNEEDEKDVLNGEFNFNDGSIKGEHIDDNDIVPGPLTHVKVACSVCSKTFKTKWYLKQHMNGKCKGKVEELDVGLIYCDGCDKEFSHNGSLKIHKLKNLCKGKVNAPKIYHCDECDKSFTIKQSLKRHKIRHASEFPCWCEQCGKTFARADLLEGHVRSQHNSDLSVAVRSEDKAYTTNSDKKLNAITQEEEIEDDNDFYFDEEAAYPAVSLFCEEIEENIYQETK